MYTIQEVSKKTGLTAHTLRYYEKEGLLSGVERTQGGFRQYTDEDLERLSTHEGDHTLKERVELLREHRERVLERMEEMQKHLDKVTWKLNFFSEKLRAYEEGKAEKK